ncbi:AI-2E family transporter [Nocardioides zeae]|uniref:AI-2E family transporter n=1 Tax=Nocardioides imazamoxiresistens TaxID=3231893 RepID=A0ABU3PW57_9ACTN|nr:AI-2E family transporter [Nocardioides zeae]MDT9593067.1 AI-2E family transporter [Nocardioides zeae]
MTSPTHGPGRATPDRADVIDKGLARVNVWGIRLIVGTIALYILGWIIGHTWVVWFPIALALVLSTLLAPPATFLRKRGFPSALAAVVVMLGFLGSIALTVYLLAPQVAGQSNDIADSAVTGVGEVRTWLQEGPLQISDGQITSAFETVQDELAARASDISAGVVTGITTITNILINLVLMLLLTFFFIKDGHRFLPWVSAIGGQRVGGHFVEVISRAWNTLGGFIRTQALVSFIDALFIGIGLVIIGVPLAIPLAILTFFAGFIPIVGAISAGAIAVLVALVTNGPTDALIVLVLIIAVQQIEGNLLSPWLQGKSMNLHAGIVLMSVTAGSTIFGITGAFLAVPVAAIVAEVFRYLNESVDREVAAAAPLQDSHGAEGPDGPAGANPALPDDVPHTRDRKTPAELRGEPDPNA